MVDALVRLEAPQDGILTVTMADAESGNALGEAMVHALRDGFQRAADDATVRAVVLAGEGAVFSSGAPRELLLRFAR